jgi:hypothetical protein
MAVEEIVMNPKLYIAAFVKLLIIDAKVARVFMYSYVCVHYMFPALRKLFIALLPVFPLGFHDLVSSASYSATPFFEIWPEIRFLRLIFMIFLTSYIQMLGCIS